MIKEFQIVLSENISEFTIIYERRECDMNIGALQMAFDLGTFFSNLTEKGKEWGGYFIIFLGVVLIIVGVVKIVKGFATQGRGQTNWLMAIGTILVGGFLVAAGFNGVNNLANIGAETINQLGGG